LGFFSLARKVARVMKTLAAAMVLSRFQLSQYNNAEIIRGRYNYGKNLILPKLAHNEENDKPILPKWWILTFAVLNPGSEATLISRLIANLLHLQGPSMSVQFGAFSSCCC
jgi:hypothetical protein